MKDTTAKLIRYYAAVNRLCRRNHGLPRHLRAQRLRHDRTEYNSQIIREFAIAHSPKGEGN